jgi:hypothetical protein
MRVIEMNITVATAFFILSAAFDLQPNPPPPANSDRAVELVKQLADPQFNVREAAGQSLAQMGPAALDALKDGEKHPDLEVRERCRELQSTIRRLDAKRRMDSFLTGGAREPLAKDLPFLASFLKAAGDSKDARKFYAEMLRSNLQLLDEVGRDRKKGAELFVSFCDLVQFVKGQNMGEPTKADVALFLLFTLEFENADNRFIDLGYDFVDSSNLKEVLGKEADAHPLKRLFLNWVEKGPMPHLLSYALRIAADAKMKETLPLVLKYSNAKDLPDDARFQIILLLVKVEGAKDHLNEIESLLNDKTIAMNNLGQPAVQVRDLGLWACVQISGQKLDDYKFDSRGVSFKTDENREAAFKKYFEEKMRVKKE